MKTLYNAYSKRTFLIMAIITVVIDVLIGVLDAIQTDVLTEFLFFITYSLTPLFLRLFWFTLIARDSKIMKSPYGILLCICFLAFGLGLLAKFEHYSWAGIALTAGGVSSILIYTIRFLLKKTKKALDIYKWLFVLAYFGLSLLMLEHYLSSSFKFVVTLLFYTLIFMFAHQKDNQRESKEDTFSFEKT